MTNNNQRWKILDVIDKLNGQKQPQSSEPMDIRIVIWGTSRSGKTTYLTMLYDALVLSKDWEVSADDEARQFVKKHTNEIEKGNFPPPTEPSPTINIFTYTLRRQDSSTATGSKILLNFIDAPGEVYEDIHSTKVQIAKPPSQRANAETQLGQNQNNLIGIVDYLLSCDGIIFLLDPMPDKEKGDSYKSLLSDLFLEFQERSRKEDMKTERLQQYMAFCVTKVDKAEIWSQIWTKVQNPAELELATIQLEQAAKDLAEDVMGQKLFTSLETNFCVKNRYKFFSVASIGRYFDEKDKTWKEAVIYPQTQEKSNTSEPQANPSLPPSPKSPYQRNRPQNLQAADTPSVEPNNTPSSNSSSTGGGGFASDDNTPNTPELPPTPKPTINTKVKYEPFNVIEPIEWLIDSIQKQPPFPPEPKQKSPEPKQK